MWVLMAISIARCFQPFWPLMAYIQSFLVFFFFLKLRTISDSYWPLLAIAAFGQKWPIVIFLVIFFGLLLVKMGKMDQKRQKKMWWQTANVAKNEQVPKKWARNGQKQPKMTKRNPKWPKKKQPKRPKVAKSANSGPKKVTKAAQKWPRTAESSLREPKWPKKAKHKNHIIEDSEDFDAGRCRTMQSGTEQCGLMRETEGVWSQVLADDLLTNEASQSHPWLDCAQLVDMGISCGFGILLTFHAPALNVGDFVGECWHLWCVCQPNFPIWFFILPGFLCPFLCADHIGSPFPSHFYATPLRFFGIVVGKSLICMCIRLLL